MSTSQNIVTKKKFGRLPEVKLVTFKGNFEEWETFWSSFRTNVDVRDDLERSTKFIYLVQSLEGEPKEMVSGLSITDESYSIAIRILKDRYDDASRQTHVRFQKFHTLPTPKHNPKDLRNFLTEYRKVKTQLLHAVDFQQSELVIKSTLVRKLAFQTFDKICDLYVTHDKLMFDFRNFIPCQPLSIILRIFKISWLNIAKLKLNFFTLWISNNLSWLSNQT